MDLFRYGVRFGTQGRYLYSALTTIDRGDLLQPVTQLGPFSKPPS
jgi:hypothetical protein